MFNNHCNIISHLHSERCITAISSGDIDGVALALKEGVPPDYIDEVRAIIRIILVSFIVFIGEQ